MTFNVTSEQSEIIFFYEATALGFTQNPYSIGLRVAKCIENTDKGFLDTNLTSFGSTRKPVVIGVSSSSEAYREMEKIENSIRTFVSLRFYSKTVLISKRIRRPINISIIYDALFD
jgi:hypothetical protein